MGPTLEFYDENFTKNGDLMEYVENYSIVTENVLDHFVEEKTQDVIYHALKIRLACTHR